MEHYPSYLESYQNKKLAKAIETLSAMLASCEICPRRCKANRMKGASGFCKTGCAARVYNFMPHHGEEPPLSGKRGSGTIFFAGCTMACAYCQNFEFSQLKNGREVEEEELAGYMLTLQKQGCHNINLVSPTHVLPQILMALSLAIPRGLAIPLVYNTGGYELPEILKLLDGIVDIYLPDSRYGDAAFAARFSNAPDYVEHNQAALIEMHRQTGIPQFDGKGIILRGVIIRHLVLPHQVSGTERIMEFIAAKLSPESYISLMSQYLPCYKADQHKELSRRITYREYAAAQKIMEKYGLHNGWTQEARGLSRLAGIHIKPMR